MVTRYPAAIDTVFTLKPILDGQPVTGGSVEQLREAIIAIEDELGVKPSGVYATVRNRLDIIEGAVGNLRIIELQQDLGGTLENPLVIGIQGRPVSDVAPEAGQVLVWNGIAWIPEKGPAPDIVFAGDLSGTNLSQTVIGIQNVPVSDTLGNNGDVLTLNSLPLDPNAFVAPQAIATNGTYVWVGNNRNKSIDKVNLSNKQSVHIDLTSFLPGGATSWPRKIIYDGNLSSHIFIAGMDANRVLVMDPNTDQIIGIGDCGANRARSCTLDNLGNIWIGGHSGNLILMRFVIADLIANYPTPVGAASEVSVANDPEEITFDGSLIWAVSSSGDLDRIDPTGNGANTGTFNGGSWYAGVVALNGSIYVLNQANNSVDRYDPGTFPSASVESISLSSSYLRAMTAAGNFLIVPDTDQSTGSNIFKLSVNPLAIAATIPPPGDELQYFEAVPDPSLSRVYIVVQLATTTSNHGFRTLDISNNTIVDSFTGTNITGLSQIIYAPGGGGGGGGGTTFTYRPGGTDDTASNVFSSWTSLMTARSALTCAATIILDDTQSSFGGGVIIDNGSWDLLGNTTIVGFSRGVNRVRIRMGDGSASCTFVRPFAFENIQFEGPQAEQTGTMDLTGFGNNVYIRLTNCGFQNNSGFVFTLFTPNALYVFDLFGECDFGGDMIWVANSGRLTLNLYDSSVVEEDWVFAESNATAQLNVFVNTTGGYFRNQTTWASPGAGPQNVGPPASTFNSPEVAFRDGFDSGGGVLPASSSLRNATTTTDANTSVLNSVSPVSGQMVRIVSEVSAVRTDTPGDVAWFLLKGVWWYDGVTLNVVRPPSVVDQAFFGSSTTWTAVLADNGSGAIETQITGEAGKTIHWSIVREWIEST